MYEKLIEDLRKQKQELMLESLELQTRTMKRLHEIEDTVASIQETINKLKKENQK